MSALCFKAAEENAQIFWLAFCEISCILDGLELAVTEEDVDSKLLTRPRGLRGRLAAKSSSTLSKSIPKSSAESCLPIFSKI